MRFTSHGWPRVCFMTASIASAVNNGPSWSVNCLKSFSTFYRAKGIARRGPASIFHGLPVFVFFKEVTLRRPQTITVEGYECGRKSYPDLISASSIWSESVDKVSTSSRINAVFRSWASCALAHNWSRKEIGEVFASASLFNRCKTPWSYGARVEALHILPTMNLSWPNVVLLAPSQEARMQTMLGSLFSSPSSARKWVVLPDCHYPYTEKYSELRTRPIILFKFMVSSPAESSS